MEGFVKQRARAGNENNNVSCYCFASLLLVITGHRLGKWFVGIFVFLAVVFVCLSRLLIP
jgi:hypothetical protein